MVYVEQRRRGQRPGERLLQHRRMIAVDIDHSKDGDSKITFAVTKSELISANSFSSSSVTTPMCFVHFKS